MRNPVVVRRRLRHLEGPLLPGTKTLDHDEGAAWPWVVSALAVGAVGVTLPTLAARGQPPREWGGLVVMFQTASTAVTLLLVGVGLTLAGRQHRRVAATGAGLMVAPTATLVLLLLTVVILF